MPESKTPVERLATSPAEQGAEQENTHLLEALAPRIDGARAAKQEAAQRLDGLRETVPHVAQKRRDAEAAYASRFTEGLNEGIGNFSACAARDIAGDMSTLERVAAFWGDCWDRLHHITLPQAQIDDLEAAVTLARLLETEAVLLLERNEIQTKLALERAGLLGGAQGAVVIATQTGESLRRAVTAAHGDAEYAERVLRDEKMRQATTRQRRAEKIAMAQTAS